MSILNIKLLTVKEVAKILRVDESTIRRWAHTGHLKAVAIPQNGGKRHKYRFDANTVEALLQAQA